MDSAFDWQLGNIGVCNQRLTLLAKLRIHTKGSFSASLRIWGCCESPRHEFCLLRKAVEAASAFCVCVYIYTHKQVYVYPKGLDGFWALESGCSKGPSLHCIGGVMTLGYICIYIYICMYIYIYVCMVRPPPPMNYRSFFLHKMNATNTVVFSTR